MKGFSDLDGRDSEVDGRGIDEVDGVELEEGVLEGVAFATRLASASFQYRATYNRRANEMNLLTLN